MSHKFDFSQKFLANFLYHLSIINQRGLVPPQDCINSAINIGAIFFVNESDSVEYVHELWDKEKFVQKYLKK